MKRLTLLIACFFLFTAASLNDARKANEAFKNGEYERAAQLYRQAIDQNPDDARLYFNLGNALSEAGNKEEAMEAYERYRSLTDEADRQAMADYNQGKILTDLEDYDQAIDRFRDALRKNPNDADARFNYELAQRKKQEQQQQQEQDQQDNSDSDDNEDDQEQENEQNEKDQQQDPDQQPPQDQPQNQESQPEPQNMSREEAENILNALEKLERDLLENRKKEATTTNPDNDKDW